MRRIQTLSRWLLAATCALPLVPLTATAAMAQQAPATPEPAAAKIPDDQLSSLVAPIALYPDPLLAQVLVASTYPLELVQLQQWIAQHADLKGDALVAAVEKEPWDPSVQAMASLPDVLKLLTSDIKWTTDLGNAFLAQQSDVMDAVQRMRVKAKDNGALKSSSEMKVESQVVENKTVVVIEQTDPQVVYVPSYNPTVVYGAPAYPYPAISYPVAGMAISFGVGVAMGAAFHGGWGYHAGWGGGNNNININNNNNFIRNSNRSGGNVAQGGRGNNWQHNPQHRGGAPYGNRATAERYGGRTAAQQPRAGAGQQRPGGGGVAQQRPAGQQRPGGGVAQQRPAGGREQPARQPGAAGGRAPSGGDRVGNRSVPQGGNRGGAFGGGAGGYSGSSARASSSRGGSSMSGSRGGGARGGGGGRRR